MNNNWDERGIADEVVELPSSHRSRKTMMDDISTGGQSQSRFLPMDSESKSPDVDTPSSLHPTSSVLTSPQRDSLDLQQEKVSVRLVQNKGLVVHEVEDENDDDSSNGCAAARARLYSFISDVAGREFSLPALVAPTHDSNDVEGEGKCPDCNSNIDLSLARLPPFTRTRHGSTTPTNGGVSSLTPLMMKEQSYKIEMTINPSASYLKHQQRKNSIHLCCVLVFGFTASLFFSLTLLLTKVLHNREHHPISVAFWRYLGILIPSMPLALFYICRGRKQKVYGSVWPLNDIEKAVTVLALLMRAVLGSTAVILRYSSLNYLSIADSSVISYCAPVLAAVVAPYCLNKEKKGILIPFITGLLIVSAIFIICRPPFLQFGWSEGSTMGYDSATLKGTFLAILSTLCTSGVLLLLRGLLDKVHFSLVMIVLGLWGTFEAGVMALTLGVLKVPELLPDIVMLTGLAILSFFGQLSMLLAMRMGRIGSVSVIRSCDILLAFLWQYLFLKTEPDIYSMLSGILIIFAVCFIFFRKWVTTLRVDDRLRKKLAFILL